ncbi:MAG: hypothetical protein EHM78_12685 [Myxococcaceae bacterium]|nr:MAG: hypothetical protein EHM78_12685 [Myxococcaceae bacterium]
MKIRLLLTAAVLATGSARAADVGVSVSVGDSGFYGRIDVGTMPRPPPVVYAQPVLVQSTPVAVQREPIYLRVPPGHAKKWRKHCHKYNACGERVFFVQEGWYNDHYSAGRDAHRGESDDHPGKGNGKGKGHGKGS